MDEFISFAYSFFSRWGRLAGLLTLVLAGATVMQWIKLLYVPRGMDDIDDFIIGGGVVIMAVCSVGFLLIEADALSTSIKSEDQSSV